MDWADRMGFLDCVAQAERQRSHLARGRLLRLGAVWKSDEDFVPFGFFDALGLGVFNNTICQSDLQGDLNIPLPDLVLAPRLTTVTLLNWISRLTLFCIDRLRR